MIFSEIKDEDLKNINRRPRDSLVFITKEQLGSDMVWMLPGVEWREYETMKDVRVQLLIVNMHSVLKHLRCAWKYATSRSDRLVFFATSIIDWVPKT